LGVVLAVKVRSNLSSAQSLPHVPESGEPLANGPYRTDAAAAGDAQATESANTVQNARAILSERSMAHLTALPKTRSAQESHLAAEPATAGR
jgi:hypothetical protein